MVYGHQPVRQHQVPKQPPEEVRHFRRGSLTSAALIGETNAKIKKKATDGPQFESLNYDEAENDKVRELSALADSERQRTTWHERYATWAVVIVTGFLTGSTAYLTTWVIGTLTRGKFGVIQYSLMLDRPFEGWLLHSAFVITLVGVGALLVCYSPEAAGVTLLRGRTTGWWRLGPSDACHNLF